MARVYYRPDVLPVTQLAVPKHWKKREALTHSSGLASSFLRRPPHYQRRVIAAFTIETSRKIVMCACVFTWLPASSNEWQKPLRCCTSKLPITCKSSSTKPFKQTICAEVRHLQSCQVSRISRETPAFLMRLMPSHHMVEISRIFYRS